MRDHRDQLGGCSTFHHYLMTHERQDSQERSNSPIVKYIFCIVEYDSLLRLGITDTKSFIKKRLKGEQVQYLESCCVGSQVMELVESEIDEALTAGTWINIMVWIIIPEICLSFLISIVYCLVIIERVLFPSWRIQKESRNIVRSMLSSLSLTFQMQFIC